MKNPRAHTPHTAALLDIYRKYLPWHAVNKRADADSFDMKEIYFKEASNRTCDKTFTIKATTKDNLRLHSNLDTLWDMFVVSKQAYLN